jgi:hypothetical protein
MEILDSVVAVFDDHQSADAAVKKLTDAGFEMKHLSVVGKGYHTDEKVIGFYNMGDRVKFFGGLFLTIPVLGHVVVLGYLAATMFSAVESAVLTGGVSALGAVLYSIGIPKDSVVQYETAIKADGFLVMAHGSADEMVRAKSILGTSNPSSLAAHAGIPAVPAAA